MNCPKCGTKLVMTPMSMCITKENQKENFCHKCFHKYSDRELQDIADAILIEEDTEIWKESREQARR